LKPVVVVLGISLPAWHLFFLIAVFTGGLVWFCVVQRLLSHSFGGQDRRVPLPVFLLEPYLRCVFILSVYCAGVIGARLLPLVHWLLFREWSPGEEGGLFGPMSFHGGVFGGAAAGVSWLLFTRQTQLWRRDLGLLVDSLALPVVVGLALGRIGCLLNGDDYGLPLPQALADADPWWSFASMGPGNALRYPTQLQEAFFNLVLFVVGFCLFLRPRLLAWMRVNEGVFGAGVLAVSALNRVCSEFFRGDPRGLLPGTNWPMPQALAAVLCLILFAYAWIQWAHRGRELGQ
jgi:phosphatidylglycerol:prolipoprotein diacylglycerol transferase